MRGGPSLKGKGGLVGFRKTLKVQGRTFSFSKVQEITFTFSKVQEITCRLSKNLLSIKRGFSKAFFKADLQKNKAYFLIVNKKYQNLIRNPT